MFSTIVLSQEENLIVTWNQFLTINIKVTSFLLPFVPTEESNSTSSSSCNLCDNMLSCIQTSFPDRRSLNPKRRPFYSYDAYFMVATCPQQWVSSHPNKQMAQQIFHHCTNSSLSPVTDLTTTFTFRNIYCAQCNNITQSQLVQWNAKYICISNGSVFINSVSQIRKYCEILSFTTNTKTRYCSILESICPIGFDNQNTTSIMLCETQGLNIIKGYLKSRIGAVLFKNKWCAECNGAFDTEEYTHAEIEFSHETLPCKTT